MTKVTENSVTAKPTFVNLVILLQNEANKRIRDFIDGLTEETEVKGMLTKWQYSDILTATDKKKEWTLEALKERVTARKQKELDKSLNEKLARLETVYSAPEFVSAEISVEWKKSRMWGNNPTAQAHVIVKDETYGRSSDRYNSGSIGGCGYDKQSTAVANSLNQSNSFLKLLYTLKDQNPTIDNRELFGYGSGNGILPYLEGGVGVSCYPTIFEKVGFEFKYKVNGKSFDYFEITKK